MPCKDLVVCISGAGHTITIFDQRTDVLSAVFKTSCRNIMKSSRGSKSGHWEWKGGGESRDSEQSIWAFYGEKDPLPTVDPAT